MSKGQRLGGIVKSKGFNGGHPLIVSEKSIHQYGSKRFDSGGLTKPNLRVSVTLGMSHFKDYEVLVPEAFL
jgi:hypothetical protein